MGLAWVRVDTGWPTNPKVASMVRSGLKGRAAAFAYIGGLCYSGKYGLDGFVPRDSLDLFLATTRDADILVEFSLWHEEGTAGWRINDWTEYQQTNEETQKRSEKARKAAQKRWAKNA